MARKPNIDEFFKVSKAKGGIISGIAGSFGVARKTIYEWCEKDSRFQEAIDDSRETFLDIAETNLQTLVKGIPKIEELSDGRLIQKGWEVPPSESAIIFALRTIGKKRGYTEKQEIDTNMRGSISINEWVKDRIK